MSGSTTTEKRLQDIEVVSTIVGLRFLTFNNVGKPFAVESGALPTGSGGTSGGGAALSDATPLALTNPATPGTSPTAARSDHRHPMPTIVQLGAAAAVHSHSISNVTELQNTLDSKAASVHTHTIAQVSALQSSLDNKAAVAHTHAQSDVTGLTTSLAATEKSVNKGAANGYAPLDATGKVPAANLPTTATGGTGGSVNLDNGTVNGQVAVWNNTTARWQAANPSSIVLDRTPTVERNSATVLSFADYNRRNIVLTGNASMTLAASEIGTAPVQGMEFIIYNNHTAINTITFGAGITVNAFPAGTGTAGAVKVASKGAVAVSIMPVGTSLIALVRGQVA